MNFPEDPCEGSGRCGMQEEGIKEDKGRLVGKKG